MTEFITNIKNVGIATTVIALVTIFLVGCLKFIPALKNMKNTDARKAVYQILSFVVSGGLSVAYHIFIAKGGWDMNLLHFTSLAMAEVNVIYPLYENLGLRALLKKLGSLLLPSKKDKIDSVVDTVADSLEGQPNSEQVAKNQAKAEKTGWLQ